jgi:PAS domain S-box-containing protein
MTQSFAEHNLIFEHIFQFTPIGIAIMSPEDGIWIKINPALCHILGYSESELLGMTFADVTHEADANINHNHIFAELSRGNSPVYQAETRYRHKDGHIVWASLRVSMVVDDQTKEPLYYIGQIIDITGQKHAEKKQLENQALLKLITESLTAR